MVAGGSGKGAGVCLSGESASTFLDWYDDIMRAQTAGQDSNTTNADDRSAAVRDKITKLLSATEGAFFFDQFDLILTFRHTTVTRAYARVGRCGDRIGGDR